MKNNYPLPLILDIIENIGTKNVFTKMDLKWSYNNIRRKISGKQPLQHQKGCLSQQSCFWTKKFTSHILGYDKQVTKRLDQHRESREFH